MPRTPDRTQPRGLLVKGVPPTDGPFRPPRPIRTTDTVNMQAAIPSEGQHRIQGDG